MRISDWSSDVCSSDLSSPLRATARITAFKPGQSPPPVSIATRIEPPWPDPLAGPRVPAAPPGPDRPGPPRRIASAPDDRRDRHRRRHDRRARSEEHTSEHQSLMRISYAVFFLKNKKTR